MRLGIIRGATSRSIKGGSLLQLYIFMQGRRSGLGPDFLPSRLRPLSSRSRSSRLAAQHCRSGYHAVAAVDSLRCAVAALSQRSSRSRSGRLSALRCRSGLAPDSRQFGCDFRRSGRPRSGVALLTSGRALGGGRFPALADASGPRRP